MYLTDARIMDAIKRGFTIYRRNRRATTLTKEDVRHIYISGRFNCYLSFEDFLADDWEIQNKQSIIINLNNIFNWRGAKYGYYRNGKGTKTTLWSSHEKGLHKGTEKRNWLSMLWMPVLYKRVCRV